MKKYHKIHTLQHDQTDCGVACLKSVLRFHGADASLEKLRELSGTSIQGTTLRGLQEAAGKKGLEAEGFEVDNLAEFKAEATFPCILHITLDHLEHYVVCYKADTSGYLIGDPAKGVELWSEEQLLGVWRTRAMLNLKPTEALELTTAEKKRQVVWFLGLVREDIPLLASSSAMGVVIAALGLTSAYFTQKLIDDFLPNQQITKILAGLALLLVLLIVRSAINYVRTLLLLRQSRDFNNRTAGHFYDTLLLLPKAFFDTRKTGDLITRMNDTRRIQGTILLLTNIAVIDLLVIVVSLGVIFSYSPIPGLICLAALPLFAGLAYRFTSPVALQQKEMMAAYGLTESNYIDTIKGISVIKSNGKEKMFSETTRGIYTFFQEKVYELGQMGNRYSTMGDLINTMILLSLIGACSLLVIQNKMKTGELMAVISIAGGFMASAARLANTNIQVQEAKVAFDRMFEFTDTKTEGLPSTEVHEPATIESITLAGISFRFPGRSQLLRNVSLTLRKGHITMLSGEVGRGKSVILNIIQRFYLPETGEITVNEKYNALEVPIADWRRKISVVEQEVKIFNSLLIHNISLGENLEGVPEFCRQWGFEAFFNELPQGLLTKVGEDGLKLSGGQKQLVALARALYKNSEVLLLDEPTASMDGKTTTFVMNLLAKIKKDKLILMVAHREDTIRAIADDIHILYEGETLRAEDSTNEIPLATHPI